MAVDLKRELLRLLDEDEEFRYAVAGRIGILEILRRLDRLEEGQNKLWENQNRLWEEVRSLREGQNKLWENTNRLWENQNRLWEEVRDMRVTLNRVAVTLDRLTISVEEEALSFIKHRLKTDMGIDVKLTRIFIDSREINIYGCSEDVCVVGEAAVRLGTGLVEELLNKIDLLKSRRPDLLRAKLIKAIYTDYATPDSLEYARERGVWVLKWSGDLTPLRIEEM